MQGFDPQTILPRIAAQGLERQEIRPGDWFDDDGMLMCGKCGEPRQGMVTVSAPMEGNPENKMTFKATRSCKCDRDKEAAEKQAEQNKKDMERVARLKKASLMDEKLREASFDSFQVTKYNARNLKLCRRYAEAFDEMVSKNQGLIFWGSVGTGKSFAAACIANHLLNRGVPVMMTSLVKLLELIQGGEEKESDIIARMNSAKLVIFDDLGAERNTDYALEKIYNIIDSRYRRKLPMLLTTNLTIDEMKDEEDRRYDPRDPFRTRGSRLGMPEFYHVTSRTGSFTVHDSRCLVFQNGILPENTTNSIYQLWGIPEYVRINRAIRDAEVAHGSATKLLDRSVQAVYKMKDLAAELATEEGEDRVLRRLQTIDMARGLLNSITIDSEGEDYDFRQFQFSGVSDVIDSTCNFLSALTSIPQTILFGRSPAGMNATGDADLENWYNYLERIQKRMVKKNLRYLLSVIFQAGVRTGEVDEVPKIKVEFNPLWSLSDTEQADLDQKRAQTQFTRAQTAQLYIDKQVIDPSEVRAKLADSEEFDVENMLDEYDDEDLFPDEPAEGGQVSGDVGQSIFEQGQFADYAEGTSTEEHKKDPGGDGEAPAAAPAATKLPQDMSDEERQQSAANAPQNRAKASVQDVKGDGNTSTQEDTKACVGVLVVSQGKVLSGTRKTEFGHGLICGPGGHIKEGESPKQAAFREAEEEFGISPKELIPLGRGPMELDTGIQPYIFLCTEYEGEPNCVDGEMADPQFRTLEEIELLTPSLFQPFADDVKLLKATLRGECDPFEEDGGPGSGNFGHEGRKGEIGGSEEREGNTSPYNGETSHGLERGVYSAKKSEWSKNAGRELSDREVQEMVDATSDYTRNYKDVVAASAGYSGVYATRGSLMDSEEKAAAEKSAAAIEKAISLSDKYAGTTKRAMTTDKDAFDKFIAESSGGSTFGLGHLSSWSTGDDALKRVFRSRDGDDPNSYNIVLECKSKSGVSIKDVADVDMDEVLYSKKARFKVVNTDPDYSVGKYKAVKLTLEEVDSRGDSSNLDGGPSSGNFGHEGVPGRVGGSAPSLTPTALKLFQR